MAKTQIKGSQIKKGSQQITFNDLHKNLRILIVMLVFGFVGLLFLSVSNASPLTSKFWPRLRTQPDRSQIYTPSFNLPTSGTGSSGSTTTCKNSQGSTVTTGDATSSNGGTANTGGNVACGQ